MANLRANPPRFSDGSLNSTYWCVAVDINRYHDFDRWSGRRLVKTYTSGSGRAFLSRAWGYMYLPIQVGSEYQRKNIKYTNTGRVIISRLKRELTAKDLTDTEYLGPNFDIECYNSGGVYYYRKVPFVDTGADSVNMLGWQDGITQSDGDPFQDAFGEPNANPGDDQHCADPKLKESYQNHVEQVISTGAFCRSVDATFIANWNYYNYWWVTESGNNPGGYYDGETYIPGYYTYKRIDEEIWFKAGGDYRQETPSYANGWSRIDYGHDLRASEPTYAALEDELNGCNRSAFECALRNLGLYDWYFSSTHSFQPQNLLLRREELRQTYPPMAEEEIEAAHPLSHGTYRRTWRYTFGRPKSNYVMLPGNHTPPAFDYTNYQGATSKIPFIGSFVPSDEIPQNEDDVELTEQEKIAIKQRHDPVLTNGGTSRFEQVRNMLNDMWNVLEGAGYSCKEIYPTLQNKTAGGQTDTYKTSDTAAYAYAVAQAEAAIEIANWGSVPSGQAMLLGSYGLLTDYYNIGWAAWFQMWKARFVIAASQIPENTKQIVVFCKVKPWAVSDLADYALCRNLEVDLDEIQEIPNFNCLGYNGPPPWVFPDDYPAGWVEWGGTNYYAGINGKTAAVVLELGTPDEDGNYYIDVPVFGDHPPVSGLVEATPQKTVVNTAVTGRADVSLSGVFPFVGYKVDLETGNADFTTKKYVTWTAIAVDDGLFGTDGYPN